jgi:hypothetical protein
MFNGEDQLATSETLKGQIPLSVDANDGHTRIAGIVLNSDAEPIRAMVTANPGLGSYLTDDSGFFVFEIGVEPGATYTILASSLDRRFKGSLSAKGVAGKTQRSDLILQKVDSMGFSIQIYDGDLQPIKDAIIRISELGLSALSDSDGRIVFDTGLDEQKYTLVVVAKSYARQQLVGTATKGLTSIILVLDPV